MKYSSSNLFTVFSGKGSKGNAAFVHLVDKLPDSCQINSTITQVYLNQKSKDTFAIRWFKNGHAIQRCGHGTLAAAAFITETKKYDWKNNNRIYFLSDKEKLTVKQKNQAYALQLPALELIPSNNHLDLETVQIIRTQETPEPDGYLIIELADKSLVKSFELIPKTIQRLGKRALLITAANKHKGEDWDICFRYLAPYYDNQEDSATGSAASVLWPFWSGHFDKNHLNCYQASPAGGRFTITREKPQSIWVTGSVIGEKTPEKI